MIKIVRVAVLEHPRLELTFSDGSSAHWSAETLIARDSVLSRSLADPAYLARAFIEGGALAWPNGLELSPAALHATLNAAGALRRRAGLTACIALSRKPTASSAAEILRR